MTTYYCSKGVFPGEFLASIISIDNSFDFEIEDASRISVHKESVRVLLERTLFEHIQQFCSHAQVLATIIFYDEFIVKNTTIENDTLTSRFANKLNDDELNFKAYQVVDLTKFL